MGVRSVLTHRRDTIYQRWCDFFFESYPADTAARLKEGKNRFANPVGYTITQELATILDGLLQEQACESFRSPLTNIIKLRTVQGFTPSDAVRFIILLKRAIEEALTVEAGGDILPRDVAVLYSRIDEMALLSFDIYVACQEKIHQIALKQVRREREEAMALLKRSEYGKVGDST